MPSANLSAFPSAVRTRRSTYACQIKTSSSDLVGCTRRYHIPSQLKQAIVTEACTAIFHPHAFPVVVGEYESGSFIDIGGRYCKFRPGCHLRSVVEHPRGCSELVDQRFFQPFIITKTVGQPAAEYVPNILLDRPVRKLVAAEEAFAEQSEHLHILVDGPLLDKHTQDDKAVCHIFSPLI